MRLGYKTLTGVVALTCAFALAPAATSSDPSSQFVISDGGPPPPVECPADINNDGFVDVEDFLMVVRQWGCASRDPFCRADCNRDYFVDVHDLVEIIMAWGTC